MTDSSDLFSKLRTEMPSVEPNSFNYDSRIVFEPLDLSVLEDIHEYSILPDFFEFLDLDPSKTIDETRAYLEKLLARINDGYKDGYAMYWQVRVRSTGKAIGIFTLVGVNFGTRVAEIGKGVSPKYAGLGYSFEAQSAMLRYCFDTLGLDEVRSFTRADNAPNINMMTIGGFKKITIDNVIERDGTDRPMQRLSAFRENRSKDRSLAFAKVARMKTETS